MEKTFELKKLKLGLLGVDCQYQLSETDDDGIVTEKEYHVKDSRPIHSALRALFEKDLTEIVAMIFDNMEDIALVQMGNSRIYPTGISFAGKNDNIGIAISGNIATGVGRVAFKIPRIKYLTGDSDLCAKLTVFADAIVNEAHEYLFENKSEDMPVFGE